MIKFYHDVNCMNFKPTTSRQNWPINFHEQDFEQWTGKSSSSDADDETDRLRLLKIQYSQPAWVKVSFKLVITF